jgi:hypothetical protein
MPVTVLLVGRMSREHMAELVYELSFKGAASESLAGAFEECVVTTDRGVTTVRSAVPDQAALQGLIARINVLGLELLEVRLVADADNGGLWANES